MHFHASSSATVLFSGWHTDSVAGLVTAVAAITAAAVAYEALRFYREALRRQQLRMEYATPLNSPSTVKFFFLFI